MNNELPRILMTGHKGYLGSVMAPHFVRAGYDVTGIDAGFFDACTLVPDELAIPSIKKDIRDLEPSDLRGYDAVVHLAALSNDPIGNLNDSWTEDINFRASARLAEMARGAGVRRFLFSSSCIMYGVAQAAVATEESPLNPQTIYARSKVEAEEAIRSLASDSFSPTFLRNGTVYGLSPRMRFDTVLNNLVGLAVSTGTVTVYSDGTPWRPVVHVEDVARAFQAVLSARRDLVHNQAINIGSNALNHRIRELADMAIEAVPGAKLEIVAQVDADQRTYRADFGKFAKICPDFQFEWTARRGAGQLSEAFRAIKLGHNGFTDRRFTRLKWLNHLLDLGLLDSSLRWREPHD
jgi:nucleoside-diphosphate-sugar epimerase